MAYVWLHRLVMIKPFSDSLLFQLRGGYECKSNRFKYSESTNLIFLSGAVLSNRILKFQLLSETVVPLPAIFYWI